MTGQLRIKELYQKLKSNTISNEEFDEFLSLINEAENRNALNPEIKNAWASYKHHPDAKDLFAQKEGFKKKLNLNSNREKSNVISKRIIMYWAAASITLFIISTLAIRVYSSDSIKFSTDYAEREKVVLPDGSKVELNANSSLTWDENWVGQGVRKVSLQGEAFFEVLHLEEDQEFVVQTSDMDIEVLGTSFNVSKRGDVTEVFLEEGSIKIGLKGVDKEGILMKPGERISYSHTTKEIIYHEKNNEVASSWRKSVLYFDDKEVGEILEKVSQIYGVEFEYTDPNLQSMKLNFYVPYKDWDVAKEAFELTMNLKMTLQENGKYSVSKK
ncbi:FecR family protein [Membranihabitans marinus]|uniref:FecR family protein n=1 Tax=Membranihabitans marinus TaxID=1227546 RepID=UPI001F2A9480|nr:FecR domain-containing protein [Membranihabitans marinus]